MVMGGKQGLGAQQLLVGTVFQHRPGDGHTVERGRTPPDFVQNQQRVLCGVVQDVRHLRHLHHKGGLSGAQVVRRADAGEDTVHHADVGKLRRDKAPHLCHQHDQRHLAHVGGFARHVGAGDDSHPALLLPHERVVGDEQAVLQHPLHHRMPALFDLNDPGFIHIGAAVVVPHRHGGKGRQGVGLRHGGGGFLDTGRGGGDFLPQRREQLIFQCHYPLRGGQDLMLQVFQLLGDVPLAVHQGLLTDVCLRHLVLEGVGHLDIVSKHLVVADFQRPDAGGLFFLGLHLRHDALAALEDVPQAVHLFVEAVPDETALPDGERRLVADGIRDALPNVIQGVQLRRQLTEAAVIQRRQLLLDSGQFFNGRPEGRHVPSAGGTVDDAADEPLHIAQARHGGNQLFPLDGIVHQRRYGGVSLADGRHAQQRPLQPAPQAPGAHRGLGLVQNPQQAPLLLLAPEGLRQFQIPPGRQVQFHEPALLVVIQVVDVAQIGLLCLV